MKNKPRFTKLKDGYVTFIKEDNGKYSPIGRINDDNNFTGITGYIYINWSKSGAISEVKKLTRKWEVKPELIIKKVRVKIL